VDWVSAALPRTVWWEGCDNWYRGNAKVPVIWPWLDRSSKQMFADVALHRLDPVPCRLGRRNPNSRSQFAVTWTGMRLMPWIKLLMR